MTIGNALEWFDLIVYGYLAITIGRLFFPADNDATSFLLALATFGVTFVTRPLGAIFIGAYGDRHGRKAALALSVALMTIGTTVIAIVPTYASIGLAAPAILVCARLLQGLSAGGEFGSATVFLSEQNPNRRGFYSSWQFASQSLAALAGTTLVATLEASLTREQIETWGWRVPFALGVLLGPVAYFIRYRLPETPAFVRTGPAKRPIADTYQTSTRRVVLAVGAVACATVTAYTVVFMPSFAVRELDLAARSTFAVAAAASLPQLVLVPLFGALSDRIGRIPIMLTSAVIMLPASLGLFWWLTGAPTIERLLVVQLFLSTLLAAYCGGLAAFVTELFATRVRTTGTSICYALSVTMFGGFAPFINGLLIEATGSPAAPSLYLAASMIISIVALIIARHLGPGDDP